MWHNIPRQIIWTQASRKHRVGRAHALHVIQTGTVSETATNRGNPGFQYTSRDTRGVELEVLASVIPEGLLVMPTALRRNRD